MAINKQLANTQDLVSIEEIRNNAVLLKNGGLRQVLMVSGINTALKSEEELGLVTSTYQNFLNSLDFPVQVIVHSRKVNIERYLSSLEVRRKGEPSAILQSQISEYKEFISGFVKDNSIMEKTFLLVVPFSPTNLPGKETVAGVAKLFPFLNKSDSSSTTKKAKDEREVLLKENLDQLGQRTAQVVEGLRAIDLEVVVLGDRELIELFYNFYNPETVERQDLNVPVEQENESSTPKGN